MLERKVIVSWDSDSYGEGNVSAKNVAVRPLDVQVREGLSWPGHLCLIQSWHSSAELQSKAFEMNSSLLSLTTCCLAFSRTELEVHSRFWLQWKMPDTANHRIQLPNTAGTMTRLGEVITLLHSFSVLPLHSSLILL